MTLRSFLRSLVRDVGGQSLIEVVVATSLIATVLIPLGGAAVYFLKVKRNEPYLVALALGERYMEQTLHERSYESTSVFLDGTRWHVRKSILHTGNQVTIIIRVFRQNRREALAELMTVRLLS